MQTSKKISISFSKQHLHLYEYLRGKDNISAYVLQLIEADLKQKQGEQANWEKKVEEVVIKVLSRLDPAALSGISQKEVEKVETMRQEDRELLNSLF